MSDPTPADAAPVQAQLEALRAEHTRAQLEADQSLHDLASRLSATEADLASAREAAQIAERAAQEQRARADEAERRVSEVGEQRKGDDQGREEAARRIEEVEREKRDLLAVIDREQADKRSLEGASPLVSPLTEASEHAPALRGTRLRLQVLSDNPSDRPTN